MWGETLDLPDWGKAPQTEIDDSIRSSQGEEEGMPPEVAAEKAQRALLWKGSWQHI